MTGKVSSCHNPLACRDAQPCVFTFQKILTKNTFCGMVSVRVSSFERSNKRRCPRLREGDGLRGSDGFRKDDGLLGSDARGVNDQKTRNVRSKNN